MATIDGFVGIACLLLMSGLISRNNDQISRFSTSVIAGADKSYPSDYHYAFCSDGVGAKTAEVGQYLGNSFGIYDAHGNVSEWVEDCYKDTYKGAPTDGTAQTLDKCKNRVTRDGSFTASPFGLRSADRMPWGGSSGGYIVGFRVARTL